MRLLELLLLLVCASTCVQPTAARTKPTPGFAITSGTIETVAAKTQVSKNQVYARTWLVRANASANATAIERLRTMVRGRLFVSYAESSSAGSDVVAQVKVSGSSDAQVNYVVVENEMGYAGWGVAVNSDTDARNPGDDGYLLTEVVVYRERRLKQMKSGLTCDIVIDENVLFTVTKEVFAALPAPTKSVNAAIKVGDMEMLSMTATWLVKPTVDGANASALTLGLTSTYPTATTFARRCYLSPQYRNAGSIARVTVTSRGTYVTYYPNFVVNVMHRGDLDTLVLGADPNMTLIDSMTSVVELETLPSVALQLVDIPTDMVVADLCNSDADITAGLHLHFQGVIGNVFIRDQDAVLYASDLFLEAPATMMNAGSLLQLDVKELSARNVALRSATNGDVSVFTSGALTSDAIAVSPNGRAKMCLASSNDLSVSFLDQRKTAQVAYTGRAGGSAFACKKYTPPARVPGQIGASGATGENSWPSSADKNASSTSSASRAVASLVVMQVVAVVAAVVAAM